jgi:hypothetical protein
MLSAIVLAVIVTPALGTRPKYRMMPGMVGTTLPKTGARKKKLLWISRSWPPEIAIIGIPVWRLRLDPLAAVVAKMFPSTAWPTPGLNRLAEEPSSSREKNMSMEFVKEQFAM